METILQTSLFDFHLPDQLIAQEPLGERDASRLLLLNRRDKTWLDSQIRQLPALLKRGDLLILNNTRVIPARLRATRDSSGGKVEFLLLPPDIATQTGDSENPGSIRRRVLTRSGGKLLLAETFTLAGGCKATMRERHGEAGDVIEIHCTTLAFDALVQAHGEVPLPPYVRREAGPSSSFDKERYQTVFAEIPGAVAAPTAGLHFSEAQFEAFKTHGIDCKYLTLHVGPGTFRPVKADVVTDHFMDPEPYHIPAETLDAIRAAKREGRRVIAVGTTSLRALEGSSAFAAASAANGEGLSGKTDIFIYPPREFAVVDGLITNFHTPKSSLLMLICAFAAPGSMDGIGFVQRAYEHAVEARYRFYSYGDACLIL